MKTTVGCGIGLFSPIVPGSVKGLKLSRRPAEKGEEESKKERGDSERARDGDSSLHGKWKGPEKHGGGRWIRRPELGRQSVPSGASCRLRLSSKTEGPIMIARVSRISPQWRGPG